LFGSLDLGFDMVNLVLESLFRLESLGLDFEALVLLAHHAEDKCVILDLLLPNFGEFLRLSISHYPFA
jgi:hypothetical protein